MGHYKLIDYIDTPQRINVARTTNGITSYGHMKLMPKQKYAIEDDTVFMNSLKRARVKKRYTPELVTQLKAENIPYEEEVCKSCGGRVKKISYSIVEVIEDEE